MDTLLKVCSYLWLYNHNSVLVREIIASRDIDCEIVYLLCRNCNDTILHLLRDSPYAMQIWRKIGIPATMEVTFGLDLFQWVRANCQSSPDILSNGIPWKASFTFSVWALWKHRNRVVFENTLLNLDLHNTCIRQAMDYFFYTGKFLRTKRMRTMQASGSNPVRFGINWIPMVLR